MKTTVLPLVAVMGLALPAVAQNTTDAKKPAVTPTDAKPAAKQPEAKPDPMDLSAWEKVSNPGEHHKILAPLAGTFTAKCKFWFGGPDAPAQESTGTASSTWILGGRFLKTEFKGEFMEKPFEGVACYGYDNIDNKYVGSWMDSMSTCIVTSTGTWDAAKKTLTMSSTFKDPSGAVMSSKDVITITDNNTHKYEVYHTGPDGKDMKAGEITYTRTGAAPAAPAAPTKPATGK